MASIQFGPSDRDDRGFVKAPEPRSLADLLPTPQGIHADAQRIQKHPPTKAEWAAMIALALLLIALLAYLGTSGNVRPALAPRVPATAPAATHTSGDSVLAPSPIPAEPPAVETALGYWAPDGASAGEIDLTKIARVVELRGAWARVEMDGGGLVWTDTQGIPAAILASYIPPTMRPAPAPAATAPPPPPPCKDAGIPGKMVRVCDYAELSELEARAKQQWLEQYGGNIGVVTTPTPADWSTP